MRVYTWLPAKNKNILHFVGHMAIGIENEYFSFNPNRKSIEYESWNTF